MSAPPSNAVPAPAQLATAVLPEEDLLKEYEDMFNEDPGIAEEAFKAAAEMREVPIDALDRAPVESQARRTATTGLVGRRAPANPFHSPKLGLGAKGQRRTLKVEDPALADTPLKGRLIVTIAVNCALFLVFCQALIFNRLETGYWYAPYKSNSNFGPEGINLFKLGGLNANVIRKGDTIRIFWAMWMHSGWIHIALNIASQVQFFHMLEPDWGSLRTLLLFWFSGITGNVLSVISDPCKTTVGSSGGLFGLMGGVIPYAIEFWYTIPRPLCILIFSGAVALFSVLTSLTESTDTWAHLGGLVGGILFGFGTITTPAAFLPKERVMKKQLRKNAVMRWLQKTVNPECKCGVREWVIRGVSWALLAGLWILCFVLLLDKYEYQPAGSLTYRGVVPCCCCYNLRDYNGVRDKSTWECYPCHTVIHSGLAQNWGDYCREQGVKPRGLLEVPQSLSLWPETNFYDNGDERLTEVEGVAASADTV